MRCGIVQASELAKARRWDVAYWLGDKATIAGENVERAAKASQKARYRLDLAKRKQQAEIERVAALESTGAVRIITDSARE